MERAGKRRLREQGAALAHHQDVPVADEIGSDEPVDLQGGDVARPASQIDNGIGRFSGERAGYFATMSRMVRPVGRLRFSGRRGSRSSLWPALRPPAVSGTCAASKRGTGGGAMSSARAGAGGARRRASRRRCRWVTAIVRSLPSGAGAHQGALGSLRRDWRQSTANVRGGSRADVGGDTSRSGLFKLRPDRRDEVNSLLQHLRREIFSKADLRRKRGNSVEISKAKLAKFTRTASCESDPLRQLVYCFCTEIYRCEIIAEARERRVAHFRLHR